MKISLPAFTRLLILLACYLLPLPIAFPADSTLENEFDWKQRRDKDNIQVYTRKEEDSPYDAVMATTVLTGVSLSAMVALILDVEACSQWADRCTESRIHEWISDTDMLIYTYNNLPFPLKDRDILSRIHWAQDPQSLAVTMTSKAAKGIPETRGVVRLTDAEVNWTFTPQDDGKVQITNYAHIDPGTALPGWFINILQVETPFKTMQGFRTTVSDAKYRDASFDFIDEPE